jgi:hypothetical protein
MVPAQAQVPAAVRRAEKVIESIVRHRVDARARRGRV